MRHFPVEIRQDGRLYMDSATLKEAVKWMKPGNYLMMFINLDNDRTTTEWQRFYRVVVRQMAVDTGHSPEEMHEFCKAEVLLQQGFTSTTELDSVSWKEYFEGLKEWALIKFDFII